METFVDDNQVEWVIRTVSTDAARPRVVADVSPSSPRQYPEGTASITGTTALDVQTKINVFAKASKGAVQLRVTSAPDAGSWLIVGLVAFALFAYDKRRR